MTRGTLYLHVLLCALALGFAWQQAHKEKEKKGGPSSVVLLDAEKGDVTGLAYTWDKGSTKTVISGKADVRSAVVDVDREIPKKAPPKKKDDHGKEEAPAAIANEPPPEREAVTIPGGKNVLSAVEAIEPLKTKRTLGVVDDARLDAMGLKTPLRTLTVTTKKKTLVLELGEQSYGAQGRYARVKGDNVVHLVDAAIATGLEGGADTLLEKRVITADLENIAGFSVKSAAKNGAWSHVDKDQVSTRYFAKRDEPGVKDEAAGKLMTTLRNLRGSKLAAKEVVAALGAVVVSFAVDVDDAGAIVIDVVERGDVSDDQKSTHVVRVGRWVYELTATQAKELLDDVEALP